MRILVSAYACRPGRGSEPGIGWNWVTELARFAELTVITRTANRPYILRELERSPLPHVEWVFVPTFGWMSETNRLQYYWWQMRILPLARKLHAERPFDVAHHVTYGTHWLPSLLGRLGLPFIWGPVGGGERASPELARTLPVRGRLAHTARVAIQRLFEIDPRVRSTARSATIALAKTAASAERLERMGARDVRVFPAESLSEADYDRLRSIPFRTTPPVRIISIGRLLHWKGFDLGIEAFAEIAKEFPAVEYWIAGDGREMGRLQRLARRHGLSDRVRFLGWRERCSVLDDLAQCDIVLHPTLHDSGGLVTVEAMAAGRPPICLDTGGPALQVTPETGFKIPLGRRDHVIQGIARALRRLCADPALRMRMGREGRSLVASQFRSARLGERIDALYEEIMVGELTPSDSRSGFGATSTLLSHWAI